VARKKPKQHRQARPGPTSIELRRRPGAPKMSDTMVAFAQPLLSCLPSDSTAEDWQIELMTAALIWNAGIVGMPRERLVRELSATRPELGDVRMLVDDLLRRQRTEFASEKRVVVALEAYDTDHGVQVMAASAA
jgi:hypothetical protein